MIPDVLRIPSKLLASLSERPFHIKKTKSMHQTSSIKVQPGITLQLSLPTAPERYNLGHHYPFQPPPLCPHIIVQGIGMQQHSYPSHSMHFVFPAAPASGLTIEEIVDEAAEPGPLWFTNMFCDEEHMANLAGLARSSTEMGRGRERTHVLKCL
jgi:hypothetical protein